MILERKSVREIFLIELIYRVKKQVRATFRIGGKTILDGHVNLLYINDELNVLCT